MFRIRFRRGRIIPLACILLVAAGCLVTYTVTAIGTKSTAEASVVPTADFMAAAMRNQAAHTVEVDYGSQSGQIKYHYIRSPLALSITKTFVGSGEVHKGSYDFATRETRLLRTEKSGEHSGTSRTSWLGDPFARQNLLDPVFFVLPWGSNGPRPLYERISAGSVAADKEEIDGHACWRVDLPPEPAGITGYSVWVDPDIGFCPRRIMMTEAESGKGPTIISFQDYQEISSGVWFPMKQVNEFSTISIPEGTTVGIRAVGAPIPTSGIPRAFERKTNTYVADKATAGKTYSKESLLVQFPSGTKVHVNSSTKPITIP